MILSTPLLFTTLLAAAAATVDAAAVPPVAEAPPRPLPRFPGDGAAPLPPHGLGRPAPRVQDGAPPAALGGDADPAPPRPQGQFPPPKVGLPAFGAGNDAFGAGEDDADAAPAAAAPVPGGRGPAPAPGRPAAHVWSLGARLPRVAAFCAAAARLAEAPAAALPGLAAVAGLSAAPSASRARASPAVALLALAGLSPRAAASPGTCSKIVYCRDGRAHSAADYASPTGRSCAEECADNCCTGDYACNLGRFPVCADDGDGSCDGYAACLYVGQDGGTVGLISGGSCVGYYACIYAGQSGNIGPISGGGCRGDFACQHVGRDGGTVGDISGGSCVGDYTCDNVGNGGHVGNGGGVGDITGCCTSDNECQYAGCLASQCPNPAPSLPATCPVESAVSSSPTAAPSATPTVAPTSTPTASPSAAPSATPSMTPTSTPTAPGPWILSYDDVEANFSSESANEIEMRFVHGAGRQVEVALHETCDAAAEAVLPGALYTRTVSPEPDASNLTHTTVTVGYNFTKAEMILSSLWNATTDMLKFCQVVSLVTPGAGEEQLVIVEDRRDIEILFDLQADFVVDVNLAGGTIASATETIDFEDDVNAFKCKGGSTDSFEQDDAALPPNTELAVCVTTVNDAVNIGDVTDMAISQNINQAIVATAVIDDGNVLVPAITDKRNVPQEGFIVKTRVPLDKFTFENDKNITISGTVKLELVGTVGTRKLRALVDEDDLAVAETEDAAFALSVDLVSEAEGFGPIGTSSGHAIVGKGLFGLAIAAAIGLVM